MDPTNPKGRSRNQHKCEHIPHLPALSNQRQFSVALLKHLSQLLLTASVELPLSGCDLGCLRVTIFFQSGTTKNGRNTEIDKHVSRTLSALFFFWILKFCLFCSLVRSLKRCFRTAHLDDRSMLSSSPTSSTQLRFDVASVEALMPII